MLNQLPVFSQLTQTAGAAGTTPQNEPRLCIMCFGKCNKYNHAPISVWVLLICSTYFIPSEVLLFFSSWPELQEILFFLLFKKVTISIVATPPL